MGKKLSGNLSINALQLVLNQILGLGIFYVLSYGLSKSDFGQLNLALAILLAAFNVLSLGIDQLIIKKIASGAAVEDTLSLYVCHVLITGLSFYGVLLAGKYLFPQLEIYNLVLLIGIGKLMLFFSTPFKQVANGMEQFNLLAYMSVISNLVRCVSLLIFGFLHLLSVQTIIIIFIMGDLAELLGAVFLFKRGTHTRVKITWNKRGYIQLLRESLPQTGVVVITSALARFDWIFIGFILSAVKLAEYSFAYKIFEIATFPMLAIAPLLIPLFTKMFQQKDIAAEKLKFLIRMELIVAAFTALILNICWSPLIDRVTSGKYGMVNAKTIFILSLCMPLLYINNFLWTISFAQGRLKMILSSFIITLVVNVAGDILLIPGYKNEGAAFAFLLSCLAQTIFYCRKNNISELNNSWYSLLVCTGCALLSGLAANAILSNIWLILIASIFFYLLLLVLTAQLRLSDRRNFQKLLHW
ncbi:oligosaccharide flippase family protein [Pedobacter sp. L105]|uniref:oligosaccharide flippase family protein n=1 Tax=Pedobacter sp. L105 TaxID=1641871 RepID=UPI00131B62AA|nr:oligosaccharide flippase family protein [Pedobacter sp. L105]